MKKSISIKVRKYVAPILIALLVFTALFALGRGVNALAASGASLFKNARNTEDISIRNNIQAERNIVNDEGAGVEVTGHANGATAEFTKEVTGPFDIAFRVISKEKGTGSQTKRMIDFSTLSFIFTDLNNPEKTFSYVLNGNAYWGSNYIKALVQTPNFRGAIDQDAGNGITLTGTTLTGSFECSAPQSDRISFVFDPDSMQIRINTPHGAYGEEGTYEHLLNFVSVDLDDPAHVGAAGVMTGFERYKVQVKFEDFTDVNDATRPAKIIVYSLNNQPLGGAEIADTTAPYVKLDLRGNTEIPKGGKNIRYPVPGAEAYDIIEGKIDNISVAAQFGDNAAVPVTGGAFTPDQVGTYSLTYAATDSKGNRGTKTVAFECVETLDPMQIKYRNEIPSQMLVGENIVLPAADVTGGSGIITLTTTLKKGEQALALTEDNSFLFLEPGTYTAEYTAVDFLGQKKVFSNEIRVELSAAPILYIPGLPKAMISGIAYQLPDFRAINYNAQEGEAAYNAAKSVWVTYKGQKERVEDLNAFTPVVDNHLDTIKITYKGEISATVYTEKEFEVVVVKPQLTQDYFITDGARVGPKDTELSATLTATGYNDGDSVLFVNPIPAENASIKFDVDSEKNNFAYIDVVFSDVADSANSFFVRIKKNDETATNSLVQINGVGKEIEFPGSFFGNSNDMFEVTYKNSNRMVYGLNGTEVNFVTNTAGNSTFRGFSSDTVYIELRFGPVSSESRIFISGIMNQPFFCEFNEDKVQQPFMDLVPPVMTIDGNIPRIVAFGAEITVPKAFATDVLMPNAQIHVTVEDPNRNILFDKVPIRQALKFTANQYGTYYITYEAVDGNGKSRTDTKVMQVDDTTPPQMVGSVSIPKILKSGQTLKIPEVGFTDNYFTDLVCEVYVRLPNGKLVAVKDEYLPPQDGDYTLIYYVRDGDYAYNMWSYEFRVGSKQVPDIINSDTIQNWNPDDYKNPPESNLGLIIGLSVGGGVLAAACAVILIVLKKKGVFKKKSGKGDVA